MAALWASVSTSLQLIKLSSLLLLQCNKTSSRLGDFSLVGTMNGTDTLQPEYSLPKDVFLKLEPAFWDHLSHVWLLQGHSNQRTPADSQHPVSNRSPNIKRVKSAHPHSQCSVSQTVHDLYAYDHYITCPVRALMVKKPAMLLYRFCRESCGSSAFVI